jgi:hypothetical protein
MRGLSSTFNRPLSWESTRVGKHISFIHIIKYDRHKDCEQAVLSTTVSYFGIFGENCQNLTLTYLWIFSLFRLIIKLI